MVAKQPNPWNEERRLVLATLTELKTAYDNLAKDVKANQDNLSEKMETNQVRTEFKLDTMANGHDRKLSEVETKISGANDKIESLKSAFGERIRAVEVRSGIYAMAALGLSLLAKQWIGH